MSDKPVVSVIIPFLNAERFIQESIESVCAQTYENWELLLVDDGSTDRSTVFARRYAEQYPGQVHYLEHDSHQNLGVCASRNLGIRHAKGQCIALLDSDDVWWPHKLEQQVAILESQPEAAMVYGHSQRWYSWTGNPEDIQRDSLYELGVQLNTLIKPPTLLTLSLGRKAATPCPSDIMLRRELVERVGGFEEAFRGIYQHCEDLAFLYKVYLKAPVFVSSECWNRYREHPDSCSSVLKKSGKGYYVWLFFLNWLEEYLLKQGVKDIEIWKALQKELWPYSHPILYPLLRRAHHLVGEIKGLLKRTLPLPVRRWLWAQRRGEVR